MSIITQSIPGAGDATLEEELDRLASRLAEQGTTTTPFDVVLLNDMSRYHLTMDALKCTDPGCTARDSAPILISELEALISWASSYSREHLEDPPEIRDWVWAP